MNAGQLLLKSQFPSLQGLGSTLSPPTIGSWVEKYIQVLHCYGNHWIATSTIGCSPDEVNVYDSLYCSVDNGTKRIIQKTFGSSLITIRLPSVQKQIGSMDCGLFAITFITCLAHGKELPTCKFKQHNLRSHFIDCLEMGLLSEIL